MRSPDPSTAPPRHPAGALALLVLALLAGACGGEGPASPGSAPTPTPLSREQAVREAVRITAVAQLEVMRRARSGMTEGDVKALIDQVFRQEGADGVAFEHIVAAGAHAVEAHYFGSDGVLADGDLLVVDIGATKEGWASDLTRTIPVSGRFTSRQRELYRLALDGQLVAARRANTGVHSLQEMQGWVTELYHTSSLRARGADGSLQTLDAFNPYRLGHYMGREVHGEDTGWDWTAPLQDGQALTIEPGMYISSEAIGLRVEDDYWVGPVGLECLSCPLVPRRPEEIEAVMDATRVSAAAATALPAREPLPLSPHARPGPHLQPREPRSRVHHRP
jgi:Xaa-Pro aminopeptidase